jgi:hypothetical protein
MLAFVCVELNRLLVSATQEETTMTKRSSDVRTNEPKASQSAAT